MSTNASILKARIKATAKPRVIKAATAKAAQDFVARLLKSEKFNITKQTALPGGAEFSTYFHGEALWES